MIPYLCDYAITPSVTVAARRNAMGFRLSMYDAPYVESVAQASSSCPAERPYTTPGYPPSTFSLTNPRPCSIASPLSSFNSRSLESSLQRHAEAQLERGREGGEWNRLIGLSSRRSSCSSTGAAVRRASTDVKCRELKSKSSPLMTHAQGCLSASQSTASERGIRHSTDRSSVRTLPITAKKRRGSCSEEKQDCHSISKPMGRAEAVGVACDAISEASSSAVRSSHAGDCSSEENGERGGFSWMASSAPLHQSIPKDWKP